LSNSHAFSVDPFTSLDDTGDPLIHNSNIIDVDSDFFLENNFKRYLIFGSSLPQTNVLKNNSLYGVQSDHGFFYVSVLPEKTASNLIAQGYHVVILLALLLSNKNTMQLAMTLLLQL